MTEIKIKIAKTDEELDIVQDMTTYAFAPSPVLDRDTTRRIYAKTRTRYLLYENNKPISTLDAIPMTQNIRGKIFKMQGIAGVASYPEGRRKGYVKRLMVQALIDAYEQGMVTTTLYPFRQSFYGRFGYITFPQTRIAKFSPSNLQDLKHILVSGNTIRYLIGDVIDRYYKFLTKIQFQQQGMALFDRMTEQRHEKTKVWVVFVVVDDEDRGLMTFSTKGFEKEMIINDFFYLDANAKYQLLNYISLHIDQFSEIRMTLFANEQPENWFFDGRLHIESRDWVPSAMGRILDVVKLNGIKVGEGQMTITISDNHCSWNAKSWELMSDDNKLVIREIESKNVDFEMRIHGFSALIYGGYQIEDLFQRGWIKAKNSSTDKFKSNMEQLANLFPNTIPSLYSTF